MFTFDYSYTVGYTQYTTSIQGSVLTLYILHKTQILLISLCFPPFRAALLGYECLVRVSVLFSKNEQRDLLRGNFNIHDTDGPVSMKKWHFLFVLCRSNFSGPDNFNTCQQTPYRMVLTGYICFCLVNYFIISSALQYLRFSNMELTSSWQGSQNGFLTQKS